MAPSIRFTSEQIFASNLIRLLKVVIPKFVTPPAKKSITKVFNFGVCVRNFSQLLLLLWSVDIGRRWKWSKSHWHERYSRSSVSAKTAHSRRRTQMKNEKAIAVVYSTVSRSHMPPLCTTAIIYELSRVYAFNVWVAHHYTLHVILHYIIYK